MPNASSNKVPVISLIVKPWGTFSTAELRNACTAANVAQDYFFFNDRDDDPLPLNSDHYHLPDGGFELDRCAKDMLKKREFKLLASGNLILVTIVPYSEPGLEPNEVEGVELPGFFSEADVLGDGRVSIISTYLWDNLRLRPETPAVVSSAYGERAWEPYLLVSFASIALDKFVRLEAHRETLGCPNDYCDNVSDIDAFFERGKWFCDKYCNHQIRKAVNSGKIHVEQLKAIKRILNKSHGNQADDGYDSCFIAYGKPDQQFAKKLYDDLKDRGVECWIYDEDALPGDPTWPSLHLARRSADRVLIICSKPSLKRGGLLKELEHQIEEDRDKLIPIAVDNLEVLKKIKAGRQVMDLMPYIRDRNYADFATKPYPEALELLLKALHWK